MAFSGRKRDTVPVLRKDEQTALTLLPPRRGDVDSNTEFSSAIAQTLIQKNWR
jgi:hypothetical protein